MFLLVCGEDSIASRNYIHKLKQSYKDKLNRVEDVPPQEIETAIKNESNISLFGEEIIYFTQGLLAYWGKQKKKLAEETKKLLDNQVVKVINWEEGKSLYDLKLKPASHIKEFKLDTSVFDLQETLIPGKKQQFITKLSKLKQSQDPFLIYSLIHKHTRLLVLLSTGQDAGKVHPFVKSKAATQAKYWDSKKLTQFYLGLTKIDQAIKTSSTPYDIAQSLEILACYYL